MKSLIAFIILLISAHAIAQNKAQAPLVERGRYLVKIGGCNDCHTPAYGMKAGQVPEKDWLVGDAVGWQGPWGTSYATNLRLHFGNMSQQQWLQQARSLQSRPPMPWFVLRQMTEHDLKAIHAYIQSLGPAGQPAPAALPPGQAANGPVIKFPG
jgi:mono/diheme cytochrome c family protein